MLVERRVLMLMFVFVLMEGENANAVEGEVRFNSMEARTAMA